MMVANTTHQYALDKIAQDYVEGRSPLAMGFDAGRDGGSVAHIITVNREGRVVDIVPASVRLDTDKRRQDFLVSRMGDRSLAWKRLSDWLNGVVRHGR